MDPVQSRAIDALQPFIALSKSATSPRAASDLISRATSAPNTYVFAELLNTPNVQSLREAGPEHAAYLTVLEIFAWGTWQDYTSTPDLPPLTDPQAEKLRLLSLIPLAATSSALTYTHLQTSLSLPTPRSLESLVTSAIYAGLITAKLSPRTQRIHVSSISPVRDLAPRSVPRLLSALGDWDHRCMSVLEDIDAQIAGINARAVGRKKQSVERERLMAKAMAGVDKQSVKRAADGAAEEATEGEKGMEEWMDVDEADATATRIGGGQRKNARTRFGGGARR
ncbi:MAG: hypothetical protein M1833_003622 [Piccolia ochrophora]|nr:MAG: hypothetical protein M1833_003622 [Piccolia ochrophora]